MDKKAVDGKRLHVDDRGEAMEQPSQHAMWCRSASTHQKRNDRRLERSQIVNKHTRNHCGGKYDMPLNVKFVIIYFRLFSCAATPFFNSAIHLCWWRLNYTAIIVACVNVETTAQTFVYHVFGCDLFSISEELSQRQWQDAGNWSSWASVQMKRTSWDVEFCNSMQCCHCDWICIRCVQEMFPFASIEDDVEYIFAETVAWSGIVPWSTARYFSSNNITPDSSCISCLGPFLNMTCNRRGLHHLGGASLSRHHPI